MADGLVSALESLHLQSQSLQTNNDDEWLDSILDSPRPPKRVKQDKEELKRSLEQNYLTPSTTFSTEWLNRLQQ
jgi:antiviral helicase SKI2